MSVDLIGDFFVASWSEPTEPAVALFTRQRGTSQIHAGSLNAAVLVRGTLIPKLAPIAVVLLLAFAPRDELAMPGTGLAELLPLNNVHIGARPEQVVSTPLIRLPR